MMEKEKLRKADIFSGTIIFIFGLWVVSQAIKMPMKDSWGGVQNVWFVSPALFPLFVGATIALLGALLVRIALKSVGLDGLGKIFGWLLSRSSIAFLRTPIAIRFYTIVFLFFSFVFMNISRVDFFPASVLFLLAFISMFYFDDDPLLKKLLVFYLAGTCVMLIFFAAGVCSSARAVVAHAADWLTIVFIIGYGAYAWFLTRGDATLRRKYRTCLILALASPFLIGAAFKYLLLVPMPKEGAVVFLLDALRYWDF